MIRTFFWKEIEALESLESFWKQILRTSRDGDENLAALKSPGSVYGSKSSNTRLEGNVIMPFTTLPELGMNWDQKTR